MPPALTAVKVPAGGVAWPSLLRPSRRRCRSSVSAAGVERAGADRGEGARGRGRLAVAVAPPAGDGAVRPHAAGVVVAGADRGEGARGRGGLAVVVVAPAGEGAVRPHPAGVAAAGAHRGEGARGRGRLAVGVVAPAGDGAVRPHPAGVGAAGAHRGEGARRAGWPGRCVVRPSRRRCRSSSRRRCGSRPRSTLPATAPAGAVAIEAPASPVGGAAAQAEPARLRERRAAARATAPQRPSRRAGGRPQARLTASRRVPVAGPAPSPCSLLSPSFGLPREPTTGAAGGQRPLRSGYGACAQGDERSRSAQPRGYRAPAPFWCPLARTSAHIDAHPRTSGCA